jgi:hypothetical protein
MSLILKGGDKKPVIASLQKAERLKEVEHMKQLEKLRKDAEKKVHFNILEFKRYLQNLCICMT